MSKAYYGDKTAEIPDQWIRGCIQGLQAREKLPFPDAMMRAVCIWFEQEELEKQYKKEQADELLYRVIKDGVEE